MDETGWLEGSAWEKPGRRWGPGGMQAVTEGGGLLNNPESQPPPIRVQMGPHGANSRGLLL